MPALTEKHRYQCDLVLSVGNQLRYQIRQAGWHEFEKSQVDCKVCALLQQLLQTQKWRGPARVAGTMGEQNQSLHGFYME